MNKAGRVNIRGIVDPDALRVLRSFDDLAVAPPGARRPRRGAMAILSHGDTTALARVEYRAYLNAGAAWTAVERARDAPAERVLVVADHSTAEGREVLRRHGIGYAFGSGELSLALPGVLLHIEVQLILGQARVWGVRDLAREAGVSVGLAHSVLERLHDAGVVAVDGSGPGRTRHVARREALLDLWCEEQVDADVEVVRCYRSAPGPRELLGWLAGRLDAARIGYAATRGAAVLLMVPGSAAVATIEVWVDSTVPLDEIPQVVGAGATTGAPNLRWWEPARPRVRRTSS